MVSIFVSALALGFVFNAAPGAVFAETLRQGVRGGFRPALAVQLGSLVGDAGWAALGLAGVGLLFRIDVLRVPVGLAGVGYLVFLSWDAWRASRREVGLEAGAHDSSGRRALRAGVWLSLTNPQNIAYWAALGSALGAMGIAEPRPAHYAVFFAGFMVASVAWSFVCAALVDRTLRRAGGRWARLTYRACAVTFLILAASALRDLWISRAQSRPSGAPAAASPQ